MARILWANGHEEQDPGVISARLKQLGIELHALAPPPDPEGLLDRPELSPEEQTRVLASVELRFDELQAAHGYQSRDLVVIHEGIAGLGAMLQKFYSIH